MMKQLEVKYTGQSSFYGKARIEQEEGKDVGLISYNTKVLEITDEGIQVNGYYSPTTARHINEYLQQRGFNKMSKKELEAKPFLSFRS